MTETKDEGLNRSLTGPEQQKERIAIRRNEVQKKGLELEQEQLRNQIKGQEIEIETKQEGIEEIAARIEKGKKLVSGAKIIDVFPEMAKQKLPVGVQTPAGK